MCMSSSAISTSKLSDKAALCCYLLQQVRQKQKFASQRLSQTLYAPLLSNATTRRPTLSKRSTRSKRAGSFRVPFPRVKNKKYSAIRFPKLCYDAETYDYMGAFVALTMNDPGTAWKLAQPHVKNEALPPQLK